MGTTSQKAQGYMRKSKQAGNEPHKDSSDRNSQFESGLLVKAEIKEQITHYTIRETGKKQTMETPWQLEQLRVPNT